MPEGELEHDVLTSQHIASMKAALNVPEKHLKKLETLASANDPAPFYAKSLDALQKTKEALSKRITKLEEGVGKTLRKDSAVNSTIQDIMSYSKKAEADSSRQHEMKYFLGSSGVSSLGALEGKIKEKLPTTAKGQAGQALSDVLGKENVKDAGKAGTGVKHASAGNKNVKNASCSLFFTRKEEDEGMSTVIKIVGIGSHSGPSSYLIHWSSVNTLVEGSDFKL
jgi:hypothetical protein